MPSPLLRQAYDAYSFAAIPLVGQLVAGDAESYRYLVESIRRFPDQVRGGRATLSFPWSGRREFGGLAVGLSSGLERRGRRAARARAPSDPSPSTHTHTHARTPQDTFAAMIRGAGFRAVTYENLSAGVVALHSGFKL